MTAAGLFFFAQSHVSFGNQIPFIVIFDIMENFFAGLFIDFQTEDHNFVIIVFAFGKGDGNIFFAFDFENIDDLKFFFVAVFVDQSHKLYFEIFFVMMPAAAFAFVICHSTPLSAAFAAF